MARVPSGSMSDWPGARRAHGLRGALARARAARAGGLSLAGRVWHEVWDDEIPDRAAALSYYLVFSMFPALLFLAALVGLLPWHLMDQLMEQLNEVLPSDVVRKTFAEIVSGARGGLLSAGFVLAFWTASSGMGAIMSALNAVNDLTDRRPWWRQRLVALGLTLAVACFTPAALALLLFGEQIGTAVAGWLGFGPVFAILWDILRWPAIVLLAGLGVGLVYQFAPAERHNWRWITPGAVLAVVSWIAMSVGLKLYVTTVGGYNKTYGSIAGVILTLLWLYLSGLVFLIGAEIDSEMRRAKTRASR